MNKRQRIFYDNCNDNLKFKRGRKEGYPAFTIAI